MRKVFYAKVTVFWPWSENQVQKAEGKASRNQKSFINAVGKGVPHVLTLVPREGGASGGSSRDQMLQEEEETQQRQRRWATS